MELAELCESALVNYLKAQKNPDGTLVWPPSLQRPAGQAFALRIFKGEAEDDKDGQNIYCAAEKDFPEHIPSSANYEVPVKVVLRTPTQLLTQTEKAGGVADPLSSHSLAAAALETAMMAFGLELSLTAAQAGYTVWGIMNRQPGRDETAEYWESSHSMTLVCCAAEFPN